MTYWIGYIQLSGLYCAAHRSCDPSLRRRPVAVELKGRIIDLSPQATRAGGRVGMSTRQLRWVCPEAVVCRYCEQLYQPFYEKLWDTVYHFSPTVEPVALHAGFFDATGCLGRLSPEQWREALVRAVAEAFAIEPRVGLGPTRAIAQMAAQAGACIWPQESIDFLARAPLDWLPVDEAVREFLTRLGLRHVGELRHVPLSTLAARLGQAQARRLKQIAEGRDPRHVNPIYPPPRLSRRFGDLPGLDAAQIRQLLAGACRELHAAARLRSLAPTILRLTIEPLDGPAREAEHRFPAPPVGPGAIEQAAWKIWTALWRGEELVAAEIVLAGLQSMAPHQLDLLGIARRADKRRQRLEQAMEYIRRRFGDGVLLRASDMPRRARFADQVLALQVTGHAQVAG